MSVVKTGDSGSFYLGIRPFDLLVVGLRCAGSSSLVCFERQSYGFISSMRVMILRYSSTKKDKTNSLVHMDVFGNIHNSSGSILVRRKRVERKVL